MPKFRDWDLDEDRNQHRKNRKKDRRDKYQDPWMDPWEWTEKTTSNRRNKKNPERRG